MVQEGRLVSRNLKMIRNLFTYSRFSLPSLEGLDGELIMGSPTKKNVFQATSSAVTSYDGEPDVTYYIFDHYSDKTYGERLAEAKRIVAKHPKLNIRLLHHIVINSLEELEDYEERCVKDGYEGIMLRDPRGPYKQGRSTEREGWLLKVKRFRDSDAEIIGFEEKMHNGNEAHRDLSGKIKRSSAKVGLVPLGTLGALIVRDCETGVEFRCGGFTDEKASEIWGAKDNYLGKVIKYKYFPVGVKERPRHPNFIAVRDPSDMD
jgi:DNA ligase-1